MVHVDYRFPTVPGRLTMSATSKIIHVALPLWFAMTAVTSSAESSAILQLRPDGPLGLVHSLRFSSDGRTLYCGGNDKLVQVFHANDDRFERVHSASLRHKIGPGPLGAINAMDVSEDDRYVVAGGIAAFEQHADFSTDGIMIPSFGWSSQTLGQVGTVTLFDVENKRTRRIKTHPGYVLAASLVTTRGSNQPYLVTAGNDHDPSDCGANGLSLKRSLRVFRIDNGRQLHKWSLPVTALQPQIVAWNDNSRHGIEGLRIAVTLADGKPGGGMQLFRPGADSPIKFADPFAVAAALLPPNAGQAQALCVTSRQGLTVYSDQNGTRLKTISLNTQLSPTEIIYRVAAITSRPTLVIATTKDLSAPGAPHRLRLIDLAQQRCLLGKGIPIGNRQNPVIGADPTGRFVAATADVTEGVKVFDVRQLIAGNPNPVQKLTCSFQPVRRAVLVSKDGKNVLRVTIDRDSETETFDLIDGSLRPAANDLPEDVGTAVSFRPSDDRKSYVSSTSISGKVGQIKIESSLPPIGRVIASKLVDGRSIVAVGFQENVGEAQIRLSLYDGESGQELRRLNGHQQMISGIEYSADHRFLTTVSADGVVCVWPLNDLADHIAGRGAIHGVRWCSARESVVVSGVDEGSGASNLRSGDRVIGIVNENKELLRYDSPEQLFLSISQFEPKSTLALRIRRNGIDSDVSIMLGHATDERKPLFSFVSETQLDGGRLSWLAWSPSGPFQSSGPDIERRAGWHFNPETDDDNARFAPFAQYRDDFFGDTLVRDLLALGRLPDVWPPRFDARLAARFIDAQGHSVDPDASREYRPERPLQSIQVSVSDVPSRFVGEVLVQVDSGEPMSLMRSESDPEIWLAEKLPESINEGSEHEVAMMVRGDRISGGLQRERISVIPAAEIVEKIDLPQLRLVSHAARTQLHVSELGARRRVSVEVEVDAEEIPDETEFVAIRGDSEVMLYDLATAGNRMTASIPLRLGRNRIAVHLRRDQETTRSPAVEFEVVDPPSLASRIETNVSSNNIGRLTFDVRSPRLPERTHFRLRINGVSQQQWRVTVTADGARRDVYRVDLFGFPLSVGLNRVNIELLDADETMWEQETLRMQGQRQPEQPRLALFVADGASFESSQIEVVAHVMSKDLAEIRCHLGDQRIPVTQPTRNALGSYFVTLRLPLEVGANQLAVSAISKASLVATQTRSVIRVQRPVELFARRFDAVDADPVALVDSSEGTYKSEQAISSPKGNIEGVVRLSAAATAAGKADKSQVIRAWVNGFLQSVVRLKASDNPHELTFSVPVTLSAKENEIRLDLPGLAEAENTITRIEALCDQPSRDQTLHLLMVSTRVSRQQRKEYEQRVLDLLGVKNGKMPAFSQVITGGKTYPALTGTFSRSDNVRPLIEQCRFELYRQQGQNNTLLIYFQGDELRSDDGRFCLMTRDVKPDRAFIDSTYITSTYLGDQLDGLKCANLLFLDVVSHIDSATSPTAGDPAQPRLGVLRMEQNSSTADVSSPPLLSQIEKVLPRVGELGQLTRELEMRVSESEGLAVTDSIPTPILRMRFGELLPP